jgi:hypothetical protein
LFSLFVESVETSFNATNLFVWDLKIGLKSRTRLSVPYVDILMCMRSQRMADSYDVDSDGGGEFLLFKTIGRQDLTHVVNLSTGRIIHSDLDTGDFGVEQDFAYPLLASILGHAYLQVFNVKVRDSRYCTGVFLVVSVPSVPVLLNTITGTSTVADPGSSAFISPRSGIRIRDEFFQDPGSGSGMNFSRIRNKLPTGIFLTSKTSS